MVQILRADLQQSLPELLGLKGLQRELGQEVKSFTVENFKKQCFSFS